MCLLHPQVVHFAASTCHAKCALDLGRIIQSVLQIQRYTARDKTQIALCSKLHFGVRVFNMESRVAHAASGWHRWRVSAGAPTSMHHLLA